MSKFGKILVFGAIIVMAGAVLIQFVPYGRNHENPPVVSEPNWDTPETRVLAARACFDCHSNETQWPWYAGVAPVSWLAYNDTIEGRHHLNFSEWGLGREKQEPEEIVESIRSGEMPPAQYILMHPEAKLTDTEKEALIQGISATTGQSAGSSSQNMDDHDSDDD